MTRNALSKETVGAVLAWLTYNKMLALSNKVIGKGPDIKRQILCRNLNSKLLHGWPIELMAR